MDVSLEERKEGGRCGPRRRKNELDLGLLLLKNSTQLRPLCEVLQNEGRLDF